MTARSARAVHRAILGAVLGLAGIAILVATQHHGTGPTGGVGAWRGRHLALAFATWVAAGLLLLGPSRRRARAPALFAASMAAFALLLLEGIGLSGLVSYPQLLGNEALIRTNTLASRAEPHLDVTGTTLMDTAAQWGLEQPEIPFHYQTDRRGFRNPRDPADADLYLVGDSTVVGALVPFESTVTARLQTLIGRPTMMIALLGLAPQEEEQLFRDARVPVRDRMVLHFVFEGNDLRDSSRYRLEHSPRGRRLPSLGRQSFSNNLLIALQRWSAPRRDWVGRQTCGIRGQAYTFAWLANSYEGVEGEQTQILAVLEDFSREVVAAGGDYAVVFVPTKLRALAPSCTFPARTELRDPRNLGPLRASLTAWSRSSGVPVVDLTQPLQESTAQGHVPWFWGDTHWNAIGHAVAARAIADSPAVRRWQAAKRDPAVSRSRSRRIPSRPPPRISRRTAGIPGTA